MPAEAETSTAPSVTSPDKRPRLVRAASKLNIIKIRHTFSSGDEGGAPGGAPGASNGVSVVRGGTVKVLTRLSRKKEEDDERVANAKREMHERANELRWRSDQSYSIRMALAWSFNVFVIVFALFVSLIYALKYREEATRMMLVCWLIAYAVTFAIIEPFQICCLVCMPCLWDEETRLGRCMHRARWWYNEICAP